MVQWLRDGLGIIKNAAEIETLARSVPHSDGVYLVPAFAGLGAPHWNARARGTLFGVTRGTTSAHIARAALDSIAYQSLDVLKAMEADSGIRIGELRVDGGACANNLLMQFQADILGVDAVRPKVSARPPRWARRIWPVSRSATGKTWTNCKASGRSIVVSRLRCRTPMSRNASTAGSAQSAPRKPGPTRPDSSPSVP